MFNINDLEQEGYYITAEDVLRKFNQETIFGLVLNEQPDLSKKYCSPIRKDKDPGCFFMYRDETLFFVDFANVVKTHFSCFDLVKEYFKLESFRATLNFIIKGEVKSKFRSVQSAAKKSRTTVIQYKKRPFKEVDRLFWKQFGITPTQLLEDKVYAVDKYRLNQYLFSCYDLAYVYTDFSRKSLKIYRPNKIGKYKFTTNCKAEDIGCLSSLDKSLEYVIITKSYKDCRVLKNFGYNSVWVQNEGMKPNNLYQVLSYFKIVYVFYDNDKAGVKASDMIISIISTFGKQVKNVVLPEYYLELGVTDISDLYKNYGRDVAYRFLKKHVIYEQNTKNL